MRQSNQYPQDYNRAVIWVTFDYYEKAFNSLDRECTWAILKNLIIPEMIISPKRGSYEGFSSRVLLDANLSDLFVTVAVVRQGCLLALLLLLAVKDEVTRAGVHDKPMVIIWHSLRPSEWLECLDYADDKYELSHQHADIQGKLSDLDTESARIGLRIYVNNTMEMRLNPLILDINPIKEMDGFLYLGSMASVDGARCN